MKLKSYEEYMEKCEDYEDYEVIEHSDNDKYEVVRNNGFIIKTWRQNGMKHRLEKDRDGFILPAVIITKLDDESYMHRIWYENDKESRGKQIILVSNTYIPVDFENNDNNYGFNSSIGRHSNFLFYKMDENIEVIILQYKKADVFYNNSWDEIGWSFPHLAIIRRSHNGRYGYSYDLSYSKDVWYNDKGEISRIEKDTTCYIEKTPTLCAIRERIHDIHYYSWCINGKLNLKDTDEKGFLEPTVYITNGCCYRVREWHVDGILHREEKNKQGLTKPAVRICTEHSTYIKEWRKNGKLNRDDICKGYSLPTRVIRSGYIKYTKYINWDELNKIRNNDIKYYSEEWYVDDVLHREEKDENGKTLPAIIIQSKNMTIKKWMKNGEMKRDDIDEKTSECLPTIEKYNREVDNEWNNEWDY